MAQTSAPWDGVLLGDAVDAPYSASEWAALWNKMLGIGTRYPNYGILKGSGSGNFQALDVHATTPATTNVTVEIGAALVNGRVYSNSAAQAMAIQANASGNNRIDTVILRVDFVAQTARLVVKQGTPAASPVRPSLQQDATYWEIPLADVLAANGFSAINPADITPRQRSVNAPSGGWQPYAFHEGFSPVGTFNTPVTLAANGGSIAIPFPVTGNLLLGSVGLYILTTTVAYNIGWGIYIQDNEDISSTPDQTTRRIASGSTTGSFGGAAAVYNIATTGNAVLLTPGVYWLVVQNQHATNAFNLGNSAASAITQTTARTKTTSNPNGATLDLSAASLSWVTQTGLMGAWLKGFVFGDATVY